jgi:hypothetical protein
VITVFERYYSLMDTGNLDGFVGAVVNHMATQGKHWSWYALGAFGVARCDDCRVPLKDSELAFYYAPGNGPAKHATVWVCLECAYQHALKAGRNVPDFPYEEVAAHAVG